jgi:hypothetical protein
VSSLSFVYILISPLWFILVGSQVLSMSRERVRGHPACGRCGYNLTGLPATSDACSECGCALAKVGIRPCREPRRPWPWTIGTALVVIGAVLLVVWSWYLISQFTNAS